MPRLNGAKKIAKKAAKAAKRVAKKAVVRKSRTTAAKAV